MEKEENESKRLKHQNLLDDLENNRHLSAQQVLAMHRQKLEMDSSSKTFEERMSMSQIELANISTVDSMTEFGRSGTAAQINLSSGQPFVYEFTEEDILGPEMPSIDDIVNAGYLNNVRQSTERDIGGGYSSLTACSRVLQDAFTGLLWRPCSTIDGVV